MGREAFAAHPGSSGLLGYLQSSYETLTKDSLFELIIIIYKIISKREPLQRMEEWVHYLDIALLSKCFINLVSHAG